jgi:hypothetical protein
MGDGRRAARQRHLRAARPRAGHELAELERPLPLEHVGLPPHADLSLAPRMLPRARTLELTSFNNDDITPATIELLARTPARRWLLRPYVSDGRTIDPLVAACREILERDGDAAVEEIAFMSFDSDEPLVELRRNSR